jgi:alpha-mannosidase
MPDFKKYTTRQLDTTLHEIENAVYTVVGDLDIHAWCTHEPVPYAERTTGDEKTFKVGNKWGDLFDCAWFHFTGTVPAAAAGQKVVLLLDVNGEMCVFDETGVPVRGLTNSSSVFDYSLGKPGKRVLPITERAAGGEAVDVWADAGCNDLFGELRGNGEIKEAYIATCDETVRGLFFDYEVLLDLLHSLAEDTPRYQQILTGLNDVEHLLYSGLHENAAAARGILAPLLARQGGDAALKISAIGHAHIDLAWLWPLRETIRKGARTFATALANVERYPGYVFGASQPQLFQWMKDLYPGLYAKIKLAVAQGSIEPQGCMWVEADTNVAGGEALVRQTLQGKRFFKQEFGVDVRYLWLPDVFGYNAALPQILRRAGVDYFSTQKMSWSLINTFPHQSFHWQGIDGTTIPSHMLPEETYNSSANPRAIRKLERNYKDSGVSDHALLVYGIGDGGGGPGEEHLERLSRTRNLEGLSPVTMESVADFWPRWEKDAARFPTWVGELYLERHQGTLTTEARNKWYNRKMELGLREWEWTSVMTNLTAGIPYPAARLTDIWRECLLYQFHDILPGSSIKRVYDESVARYQALHREVTERTAANDASLAAQIDTTGMAEPVLVQNSLSWARTEWLRIGERWLRAEVPPMGYTVVDATTPATVSATLHASADCLENDVLRVAFAADGSITSVYDKRAGRETITPGQPANRLTVYRDMGDAWDFPMDYAEQTPRYMQLASAEARVDGPAAVLRQTYRLGYSELVQEISLTAGSARLDFASRLHWREPQSMLRTSFPAAIHANEAAFDIQFGHVYRPTHRNTTWDLARDEVAAHKWVDLSQGDYGVALLNDSKYGHKVKGNVIDLNLLRSAPYPGSELFHTGSKGPGEPNDTYTDQCDHVFTYALYPHAGDHVAGRVAQAGYELNVPLRSHPTTAHAGTRPVAAAFLTVDNPAVIVEAVKLAEDTDVAKGGDVIVRLYEADGRTTPATARFGFPVASVSAAGLMEDVIAPLPLEGDAVRLDFGPFEIKTLRVQTR